MEEVPLTIPQKLYDLRTVVHSFNNSDLDTYIRKLSPKEVSEFQYCWPIWARAKQLPPRDPDWLTWAIICGRGFGKTRTGSESTIMVARSIPRCQIAIIGKNPKDVRQIQVEGEMNGILACSPPDFKPGWNSTRGELTWPNGSKAYVYSAETPDALRGPQFHFAWIDELAKFKYPDETLDMLRFGLRLGTKPRKLITTTPRPIKCITDLLKDKKTRIVTGSTYENLANLPESFIHDVKQEYEGTRLGQQELYGEILAAIEGALWNRDMLTKALTKERPQLRKIIVAIDPAVSVSGEDETGIIMIGSEKTRRHHVMADMSGKGPLNHHSKKVARMIKDGDADLIIAERNNGGDLVEETLKVALKEIAPEMELPYLSVWASRGKRPRAEPVVSLYEQDRVNHWGIFNALETEMVTWTENSDSPNRLDALVWGLTYCLKRDRIGRVRSL